MKITILLVPVFLISTMLLGSVVVFEAHYADRVFPGVQVWNTDVSGMTRDEASAALLSDLLSGGRMVRLRGPEQVWTVHPVDLGVRLDIDATLDPAFELGRDGSFVENVILQSQLLLDNVTLPPVVVYDEAVARVYLETLGGELYRPPTDASLSIDGATPVVNTAQPGREMVVQSTLAQVSAALRLLEPADISLMMRDVSPGVVDASPAQAEAATLLSGPLVLVLEQPREGEVSTWEIPVEQLVEMVVVRDEDGVLHAAINEVALRAYVEGLAPALHIDPVGSRYHFNEWSGQLEALSPSTDGRDLDVGASMMRIVQELAAGNHQIPLVMQPIPSPFPDTATGPDIGIVELVAEGDSYFIGSSSARDNNIRVAAARFDGIVIPPGGTFSFNEYVGEVTTEEGYDESYVTAGDQLAIEVGGGICQVSTTVFRAAFWGGYPIVERWYHNNRIGYYELMGAGLGMDATVYSPQVDFRFLNDSQYPLLIETEIVDAEHRLIFRFYSTSDGRRVEADDVVKSAEVQPGPPIYQLDESLAPGSVIKWQSAVAGITASITRRVINAAGELVAEDTFVSKYSPRSTAYHYGPGYQVPVEGAVQDAAQE